MISIEDIEAMKDGSELEVILQTTANGLAYEFTPNDLAELILISMYAGAKLSANQVAGIAQRAREMWDYHHDR